jgi:hypothetical protein
VQVQNALVQFDGPLTVVAYVDASASPVMDVSAMMTAARSAKLKLNEIVNARRVDGVRTDVAIESLQLTYSAERSVIVAHRTLSRRERVARSAG